MTDSSKEDLAKSIRAILKEGDLDQLSAKKIRKMLEAEYKADFTTRKEEIDKLVMELITENDENESDGEEKAPAPKTKATNGTSKKEAVAPKKEAVAPKKEAVAPKKEAVAPKKETPKEKTEALSDISDVDDDDDDSDIGEIEDMIPKKKAKMQTPKGSKKPSKKVDDDEELAKQLQEDEGSRPSRRCKAQPIVRKQKKPRKERAKGNSVYSRPCALLPPLDGLMDTDRMPRPMIVKRIWEIVKQRELLDPKNKQFMLCDEEMLGIFGKPRIRMFGVMKHLKPYIKDIFPTA